MTMSASKQVNSAFKSRQGTHPPRSIRTARAGVKFAYEQLKARELLATTADFNGDGFEDLAVGSPGGNEVSVMYGTGGGLAIFGKPSIGLPPNLLLSQSALGYSESNARFGDALASGDFDNDGFDDLVIGAPQYGVANVGGVFVVYGSGNGLKLAGNKFFNQGTPGIEGVNEGHEEFGRALAVGDFDNDGFDDLAAGCPNEGRLALLEQGKGAVNIIYGSGAGLTSAGNQYWDQGVFRVADDPDFNDEFGKSLAAGDFDGDGIDDLAIGVPGEGYTIYRRGMVHVLFGTQNAGLSAVEEQVFDSDTYGLPGFTGFNPRFGETLSAGDFNRDGKDDLAIGIPYASQVEFHDGNVLVLPGSLNGLTTAFLRFVGQNGAGVAGEPEVNDLFGGALATGDLNGDGYDDLVVGTPGEDTNGKSESGSAYAFYGSVTGLSFNTSLQMIQGFNGIMESSEDADAFGASVAVGDFDGNGYEDLVVGIPGENSIGAVQIFDGTATGPKLTNSPIVNSISSGVPGDPGNGKQFGAGLAISSNIGFSGFSGSNFQVSQSERKPGARPRLEMNVSLTVANPGNEITSRSVVRFYLSDDGTLGKGDRLIKSIRLPPLEAGGSITIDFLRRLGRGRSWAGKHLIAVLDATDRTHERNEANNILVSVLIA